MKFNLQIYKRSTTCKQCQDWFEGFEKELSSIIATTDDPKILVIRDGETYINTKQILGGP